MWQKSIMELYRHPKEYFTNNWFLDSEEDFLDNRHALRSYAFLPPPILKELIHFYELKNIVRALEPLKDAIRSNLWLFIKTQRPKPQGKNDR